MKILIHAALLLFPLALAAGEESVEVPAGAGAMAPALAELPGGAAVLTWLEPAGDGHALKFSRYVDGAFGPAREIARGADWFANWADIPALQVLANGDWVAHWLEKSGPAVYAYDVRAVRSQDQGRTWSAPVTPHRDGTRTEHGFVSYFPGDGARAGMVWLDGRETGGDGHSGTMTLRSAELAGDGFLTGEALLDASVCDCCQTAAATTDEGPVVAYRGRRFESGGDEIRDIYLVRRAGSAWSKPQRVHADGWRISGCPVNGPAMIARGRDVVVAWFTMAGGVPRVRLARSEDGGRSFESVREFSTGTAMGRVDLAWHGREFVLSWLDGADAGAALRLAVFRDGVEPVAETALARISGARASGFPRLASLGNEGMLVAWTGTKQGQRGVQLARIPPEAPLLRNIDP